jgi:hypothetical protein
LCIKYVCRNIFIYGIKVVTLSRLREPAMPSKTTIWSFTLVTSVARLLTNVESGFSANGRNGNLSHGDTLIPARTGAVRGVPRTGESDRLEVVVVEQNAASVEAA